MIPLWSSVSHNPLPMLLQPQASAQYSLLYPPVQSTLVCLSKLYRAVDTRIFGGLAQDAVSACTLSIQQAARLVGAGWCCGEWLTTLAGA